jgi:hypothetical protein
MKNLKKYSINCSYYKKSFNTITELVDDIISSGMDTDYYITLNGKKTKELVSSLIIF